MSDMARLSLDHVVSGFLIMLTMVSGLQQPPQRTHNTSRPSQYDGLDTCLVVHRNGAVNSATVPSSKLQPSCYSHDENICGEAEVCNKLFTKLSRTFGQEDKVLLINADDLVDDWLINSIGQHRVPSTQRPNCSLLVYTKPVVDRTCLIQPRLKRAPTPAIIDLTLQTLDVQYGRLVNKVNHLCNTFRNSEGELCSKGLHRNFIVDNLFSVSHLHNNVQSEHVFKRDNVKSHSLPKCERVTITSWRQFYIDHLQISKPVVITNALHHWSAPVKWSNDFLRRRYGNQSVHIKLSPTSDYEGIERADLWDAFDSFHIPENVRAKLQFPDLVVPRPAQANMKFSDYIDLMKGIGNGSVKNASAYLEYSSIRQYFPELEQDISEMPFLEGNFKLKHLNMWLSDGNTLGKLHFDPFDNFLCMIDGKKELTLFEPHNNEMLYEAHIPEAQFSVDLNSYTFKRKTLLESTSMVMSPIDIRKADFERFPRFKKALPLNCTIDEGEVLYLPAYWWHEVQSYPNPSKARNLAVNYWYEPFLQKEFPCAECRLDVNPSYRNLL